MLKVAAETIFVVVILNFMWHTEIQYSSSNKVTVLNSNPHLPITNLQI